MSDKRQWVEPTIEEVALESDDDVLATCYTSSMTTRSSSGTNCRTGKCLSYP